MLRIQALRLFRREFSKARKDHLSTSIAARNAMEFVKKLFQDDLIVQGMNEIEKQERWGEIVDILIEWQILLKDMPLDIKKTKELELKLEEKHNKQDDNLQ